MPALTPTPPLRTRSALLSRRRLLFVLIAALAWGVLLNPMWTASTPGLLLRTMLIAMAALLAFGVAERWPSRLPNWLARWALQVAAVAVTIPLIVLAIYLLGNGHGDPPFWRDKARIGGFGMLVLSGLLLGPWVTVAVLFRQRDDAARQQALAFELQRSELERRALDARLRLLQAQVEPHFLFNTLANVRELVDSGSAQASAVLDSLIAYLRAAVPRLHEPATTLGQEVQLVRAYLELMHMRMPDRLQFAIDVDEAALELRCPPTSLLTLVENAVRHGIDPSEEGGRIDVRAQVQAGRCRLQVCDTGMGLHAAGTGLGTGLASLRERLALVFGGDARLWLSAVQPHGLCAEIDIPAQAVAR